MRKVLKSNPIPLYYQIKEIIQDMIENEELKPGDAIPPEREICEIQGVSRMTVNKAIMELVNEGALYREQGKGTFVANPKQHQQLSRLKGFTEEMENKGLKTSTKILSFEIKKATKQIKSMLAMPRDKNEIIEIKRLRLSQDEPMAIETVWISKHMFPDMTVEMIEGRSLYTIFKETYGYNPEKAKQTIEPIMLNMYESELLNQPKNALALMFKRSTYMDNDVPLEYTKAVYRSDRYKYEVVLT